MREKEDIDAKLTLLQAAVAMVKDEMKDCDDIECRVRLREQAKHYREVKNKHKTDLPYDFFDALSDVYSALNRAKKC